MPHNPENIPTSELPPGYRFLDKDEYVVYTKRDLIEFVCIEDSTYFTWYGAFPGRAYGDHRWTYRTKLSKAALAKYRFVKANNPENVPLAILEADKGYRFLDTDEYVTYQRNPPIEYFENRSTFLDNPMPKQCWKSINNGAHTHGNTQWTYRTKLSKDALSAYRAGQPPQPTSNPAILTRVHFEAIARQIRKARKSRRAELVDIFLPALRVSNPCFNETTFRKAAGAV